LVKKNNNIVELKINGQFYKLSCNPGEEEHLMKLGVMINDQIKNLISSVGQIDHNRLLLMTAIMLADKYDSLANNNFEDLYDENNVKLSKAINDANSRIELVAEKLSKI
tara:strand:- start:168 stop:494 length:327 start_codon:yes stop_codon:yes gene_type:complete